MSFSLSNLEGCTLGHCKPWKQKLVVDLGLGGPFGQGQVALVAFGSRHGW